MPKGSKAKKWEDMCKDMGKKSGVSKCGSWGCFYFVAFLGAVYYYIQLADTFWMGVLGVLKAAIWPAILIYKLLVFLS